MAHKNHWVVEKRVLLLRYEGDIDRAEMEQVNCELAAFLVEGQSPIHIISDNRKMGQAELNLNLVRETFSTMKKSGWGWIVLVDVPPLVRFFANVFAAQFGLNMKTVNTLEEAVDILKRVDKSLRMDNFRFQE